MSGDQNEIQSVGGDQSERQSVGREQYKRQNVRGRCERRTERGREIRKGGETGRINLREEARKGDQKGR